MEKLNVEYVSIESLVPHPKNMHIHSDEQIERLSKIIDYQSFRTPLTVQKGTNLIVCGHGRLMAAEKLGYKELPVIYQEFESDEQLYAHIVADNAIGKNDWAILDLGEINKSFLEYGPDLDIEMLGLKDFVIEPIEKLDPQCDEDEVPELKEDPITKRGDVWLLGAYYECEKCKKRYELDDAKKMNKECLCDL